MNLGPLWSDSRSPLAPGAGRSWLLLLLCTVGNTWWISSCNASDFVGEDAFIVDAVSCGTSVLVLVAIVGTQFATAAASSITTIVSEATGL